MARGPKQRRFLAAVLIAILLMVAAIVVLALWTTPPPDSGSEVEHDIDLEMGFGPMECLPAAEAVAENCSPWRDAGAGLG